MDYIEHSPSEIEDNDFQQVAVPSNLLVLPDGCSRGEAIEHMSRGIPTNDYGLPLYYLRSDLLDLPAVCQMGYIDQGDLDAAGELLSYTDGYPTFRSGSPFWTQAPHEPREAYLLFQRFLDLAELEGIRLIDSLAREESVPLDLVRQHSLEFYWSSRARAFDLFVVAAEAKKREVRTRKTEDTHFTEAQNLLNAILLRFQQDKDLLEKMDGPELLEAFDKMVKIQRLSLGLTGQNASTTNKDMAPASSVEVILRQLTKNSGQADQTTDERQNRLALLMSDPDSAMQIQELIVRATGAGSR
jgi:hypothetical protein